MGSMCKQCASLGWPLPTAVFIHTLSPAHSLCHFSFILLLIVFNLFDCMQSSHLIREGRINIEQEMVISCHAAQHEMEMYTSDKKTDNVVALSDFIFVKFVCVFIYCEFIYLLQTDSLFSLTKK